MFFFFSAEEKFDLYGKIEAFFLGSLRILDF